jgi:hypothetical protein
MRDLIETELDLVSGGASFSITSRNIVALGESGDRNSIY